MDMQKKLGEFNINIGVPNHDVNSDTFLTSLTSITNIISVVNKDISPSRKLEIRVKALKTGSFECTCFVKDIVEVGVALMPALASADLTYYKDLLSITIDILKIKQFLNGEEPSKVEQNGDGVNVGIYNNHGDVTYVDKRSYHYYANNQEVNDEVSKNFEKLNADSEVKSFKLEASDKSFQADRNDFPVLQQKNVVDEQKIQERIFKDQELHMFKLVWEPSNKWGFVWNGVKIQAFIKDDNFFKRIDSGEKFAKGDQLVADIKVYQTYDPSIDSYINDSYEVIKVNKHTPRPEQIGLSFEE